MCLCIPLLLLPYTSLAMDIHILLPAFNAGLLGGSVVPTETTTFARVHIHYARPLVAGSSILSSEGVRVSRLKCEEE